MGKSFQRVSFFLLLFPVISTILDSENINMDKCCLLLHLCDYMVIFPCCAPDLQGRHRVFPSGIPSGPAYPEGLRPAAADRPARLRHRAVRQLRRHPVFLQTFQKEKGRQSHSVPRPPQIIRFTALHGPQNGYPDYSTVRLHGTRSFHSRRFPCRFLPDGFFHTASVRGIG